ncbi:hypothetical protein AALA00_09075 [Lachnospiraceae bacterium 46-15]
MLNDKMQKVFKTIKQVITGTLPDKYIYFLLEDRIDLDDLVMQILFECCKFAYDSTAKKSSLRAHMTSPELDDERMLHQRTVQKINDYRMQEYLTRKEQIGIELDGLLPPNMKDIKEKIEGYQFNDFQYWEINNVHDMRLVSAITDNRILSKNFTKQIFIEYANEYDDVIRTMKEKSEEGPECMVFGSLALYTLAWKYAFDFYYNVAVEMDRTGQKYIEDVERKCSLFCGPVGLISELPPQYTGGIIHTDSRMILIREKFVSSFLDLSETDEARYREALVTVSSMLMRMTYQGTNIRKWFVENTTVEDWALVMEEYDVFQIFVSGKSWTNKRIRYVKEIYTALRQANKNPDFRS